MGCCDMWPDGWTFEVLGVHEAGGVEARVTHVYVVVKTSRPTEMLQLGHSYDFSGDVTSLSTATPSLSVSESYLHDGQDRLYRYTNSWNRALDESRIQFLEG